MNPCLFLNLEGQWAVSGCSLQRIFYTWSRVCVTVYTSQCNVASSKRKTIGFRNEEELADAVNEIVNDSDSDTDNIPEFSSSE